jgi:hypothetical protein
MPLSWNGIDITRVYWKGPALTTFKELERVVFINEDYPNGITVWTPPPSITGGWLIDERMYRAYGIEEEISFNSHDDNWAGIEFVPEDTTSVNYTAGHLIYRSNSIDEVVYNYLGTEGLWDDSGYRVIDFGDTKKYPTTRFHTWLNNYATPLTRLSNGKTYRLHPYASKIGFVITFPYSAGSDSGFHSTIYENYTTVSEDFIISPSLKTVNNGDGTYTMWLTTSGLGDYWLKNFSSRPNYAREKIFIIGAEIIEEIQNTPKATVTIANDHYGDIKVIYKENGAEKEIICPKSDYTGGFNQKETTFTVDAGSQFTMIHLEDESLWWSGMYNWDIVLDYGSTITV